jgi:ABC-2 type transport system permease protein
MIPYAVISLIAAFLVLVAAYFLFGVVIRGSYLDLFLTTLLFILSTLSIGLLVSTISDSQQVAFQISALVSMLPTLIFSGFIFPIRSMPFWLQILTNVTPAKFYLVILRSIILKGVGFEAFWDQVVYLLMFTTIVLAISIRRFRKVVG